MCGSVCGRSVHRSCTQLSKHAMNAARESENLIFMCDECISYSIRTVNNKVDGLYAIIDRLEKKLDSVHSELNNQKRVSENEKGQPTSGGDKTNTYANMAKKMARKVVLVRPKSTNTNVDAKKTKQKIKMNFDPKNANINAITNISGGVVAIECKNDAALEQIKRIANEKMGNEYDIEEAKERKPKIKIVGMSEKLSDDEITETLKSQNEFLANDTDLKIIRSYEVNKKYFSAIAEMSKENQEQCMQIGFVNIGWDRCKIYEEIPLTMCMKCCRYNHIAKNCKHEKIVCRKCGDDHTLSECQSAELKCINCDTANKKHGFKFDINHKVDDKNCKVRAQKIDMVKRRIQ